MNLYNEANVLINNAKNIVILQADNPDGDSLGSSLALEAILSEMGKTVHLVCGVDIPSYLKYLNGWDRVQKEIPNIFDIVIIVDTSSETLIENFSKNGSISWVKSKPVIVIDHHINTGEISYAKISIVENAVATSEIIYRMAQKLNWPLPIDACEMMAVSIMSDSLGLITDTTTPESIRIVADLVEKGVVLAKLDQARRELMRKEKILVEYKGRLLQRVEFDSTDRIAHVTIPWKEIEQYSPLYNPSMLVLDDMRMVVGVDVAIAYKLYSDGKITAKIRCNYGSAIGAELAKEFGGGGHPYASGFKITDGTKLEVLISKVNSSANKLLDNIGVIN